MVTMFEMHLGLMTLATGQWSYSDRARATREQVRASCETDLLPRWLIRLVIQRVEDEIMAGTWPLLSASEEA